MKKTDELKKDIASKRNEIEIFQREEMLDKASKAADELNQLLKDYDIALALEKSDFENFKEETKEQAGEPKKNNLDTKTLANRAFNKLVFNNRKWEEVTDEELSAYLNVTGSPGLPGQIESIPEQGGYLVPPEQMTQLKEFRKDFTSLKDYVTVVSTNSTSGLYPTYTEQDLIFQDFAEMTDIAESDLTISQATFTVSDKGLIIPISKQLVSDASINIMDFVGRQLAQGSIKTENKAIIQQLNKYVVGDNSAGIAPATTVTSYKSLNTALWKTLDGVYYPTAKIFTNQDGFLWLSNLDDGQNRPLFVPDVVEPNKYRYRGKEIVVVPNGTLPSSAVGNKTYAPFYVGDMKAFITFFERQGMELATSSELYFRKYGLALRAVVRWGVVVTDSNSMVALKVEV